MSKEQIEEMAKDIEVISDGCGHIDFYKTAEILHRKGYRKQEWISVDERLPERDTHVLAYSEKFEEIGIYNYAGDDVWWNYEAWASAKYYGITHWMPLPETPKMKGGDRHD